MYGFFFYEVAGYGVCVPFFLFLYVEQVRPLKYNSFASLGLTHVSQLHNSKSMAEFFLQKSNLFNLRK